MTIMPRKLRTSSTFRGHGIFAMASTLAEEGLMPKLPITTPRNTWLTAPTIHVTISMEGHHWWRSKVLHHRHTATRMSPNPLSMSSRLRSNALYTISRRAIRLLGPITCAIDFIPLMVCASESWMYCLSQCFVFDGSLKLCLAMHTRLKLTCLNLCRTPPSYTTRLLRPRQLMHGRKFINYSTKRVRDCPWKHVWSVDLALSVLIVNLMRVDHTTHARVSYLSGRVCFPLTQAGMYFRSEGILSGSARIVRNVRQLSETNLLYLTSSTLIG